MLAGDFVSWDDLTGRVFAVIPAGKIPSDVAPHLHTALSSTIKFVGGIHGVSKRDRVLVEVEREGRDYPLYYAPYVSKVKESVNG